MWEGAGLSEDGFPLEKDRASRESSGRVELSQTGAGLGGTMAVTAKLEGKSGI